MEEEVKYSEVVIRERLESEEVDNLIEEADCGFIDMNSRDFFKAYLRHKDVGFYVEVEGYYDDELIEVTKQIFRYFLEHQYTW